MSEDQLYDELDLSLSEGKYDLDESDESDSDDYYFDDMFDVDFIKKSEIVPLIEDEIATDEEDIYEELFA